MKKKILLFALFAFVSMSALFAQDINGHWTGKLMDQYDIHYFFKASGDTLTGKDNHYDGTVSDISNGTIKADSLSFDVPIQGQMTHVTGKLNDTVLTLYFTVQGHDLSVDLKKAIIN